MLCLFFSNGSWMVGPWLMAPGRGLRVVCVAQQWLFWLQKEHWQQLPKSPAESVQTRSTSSACHPRVSGGLLFFFLWAVGRLFADLRQFWFLWNDMSSCWHVVTLLFDVIGWCWTKISLYCGILVPICYFLARVCCLKQIRRSSYAVNFLSFKP